MTIKLIGNTLGGVIEANGTPVANVTSAQGFPFCKNKLFNGEVTRINQRGFDGNWTAKPVYFVGGTQAEREASYGYDMWMKVSATEMGQPIEAGNFRPSTIHMLSYWIGGSQTVAQLTSPASGNWYIQIPFAARNVQVEEGTVATPFEIRPISFELVQCQRYCILKDVRGNFDGSWIVGIGYFFRDLFPTMRAPVSASIITQASSGFNSYGASGLDATGCTWSMQIDAAGPVGRVFAIVAKYSAVI